MTLGDAIRNYREQSSMSQATLATELQVSQMGVSRLEANQDIRMTKPLADRIVNLLGKETVYAIDEESKNLLRVKQLFESVLAEDSIGNYRQVQKDCVMVLKNAMRGWEKDVLIQKQGMDCIICFCGEKKWILNVSSWNGFGQTRRRRLAEGIGLASMEPAVNKYSLVFWVDDSSEFTDGLKINCWDNLNFDVSLLVFDTQRQMFITEKDICSHYDGRGFFDLAVPDRAEAASRAFSHWKTGLK